MSAPARYVANFLAARGYDLPKFRIGLWMVITAFLALIASWALGHNNPQWAALTVLVTIQPSRAQTFEKTIYRFLGTLAGSVVGLGVLLGAGGNAYLSTLGLAIWSGLCVTLATVNRSYRSYGMVLAGYSAIIVALNNFGPPEMVIDVALERVMAILVGLVAGVLVMTFVLPKLDGRGYEMRCRSMLAQLLQQSAQNLKEAKFSKSKQDFALIVETAQVCAHLSTLSAHRAGTCRVTGSLHDLLICATNFLMASQRAEQNDALAEELSSIAQQLRGQSDFRGLQSRLNRALALAQDPGLEDALLTLAAAIPDETGLERAHILAPAETSWQYEWRSARQEGVRLFLAMSAIGFTAAATGEVLVNFAMISAAIVMSIASLGVTPVLKMKIVVVGQLIAAVSALICEKIFWTYGFNGLPLGGLGQVLAMGPSLLFYAFLYGHGKGSRYATDYCLALLMLLTPKDMVYQEVMSAWGKAAMVVSGGLIGYLAFRWIFPTDATLKRKRVWRMIKGEMQAIADARPLATGSAHAWRLRFVARFLRIADWSYQETRGEPGRLTLQKGLMTLAIADTVFALRRMLRMADLPTSPRRAAAVALQRVAQSDRESPELARAIGHLQKIYSLWAPTEPQVEAERAYILTLCAELEVQLADLRQQRYAKIQAALRSA